MLTAKADVTVTPATLTVVSDRRIITGTVTSQGEQATYEARFPVTVKDDSGRVWVLKSDDGKTATYTS